MINLPNTSSFSEIVDFYVIQEVSKELSRECIKVHFIGGILLEKPTCTCTVWHFQKEPPEFII